MSTIPTEKEKFDFIIKELDCLYKHRQEVTELQEKRLTSFSTIIGFGLSFVAFILGNYKVKEDEFPVLIPIFLFVVGGTISYIGSITFKRVLYRHKQMEKYRDKIKEYREIIFKYFQTDEELVAKLNFDEIDFTELTNKQLSISNIIALLNNLFTTIYFCSLIRFAFQKVQVFQDNLCILFIVAIITYLLSICVHNNWRYKIENVNL